MSSITEYITKQLTSPAFLDSVVFKITTNPRTEALVSEKVTKYAPTYLVTFAGSALLGAILYRKLIG